MSVEPIKRGRGRPKIEVTAALCEEARAAAAEGLRKEGIARRLGMSLRTFRDRCNEYQELRDAVEAGSGEAIGNVENALYQKAIRGDNVSMIFFLKNHAPENWKDRYEGKQEIDPEEMGEKFAAAFNRMAEMEA